MASFIITQSIYVLATLLQFSMESALSFTNKHYKSSSMQHRKVKKKKLMQRNYCTTYIGQKVKGKPQRLGRKIIDVALADDHISKCKRQYRELIHPLQIVTRYSQRKAVQQNIINEIKAKRRSQFKKHPICLMSEIPKFDTDSYVIGIDNHSSVSISNSIKDFISKPTPCQAKIKSFGGSMMAASGIGSVKWRISDDQGIDHDIIIDDVLYVPQAQVRLLCPQQWAQQVKLKSPSDTGTYSVNHSEGIILFWNNSKSSKTIPWSKKTNTAYFRTSPSFNNFEKFHRISSVHIEEPESTLVYVNEQTIEEDFYTSKSSELITNSISNSPSEMNLEPISRLISKEISESELQAQSDQAELLRWHIRLSHISFKKLKLLCLIGILPKRLVHVAAPKCLSCIYGKMTRRPWRNKSSNSRIKVTIVTQPGQCVSVDQLESPVPGFIAQLKGKLTKSRYRAATVFVDHASRLGYVHLQCDMTNKSTLEAKHAFETYAERSGVKVKHYHCDNGRFADNAFKNDVRDKMQSISYCGVNAHFQNGIAEKRIRDIQESARTMLIHGKTKWPDAVNINLWPYALREASVVINEVPDDESMSCKLERFSGVTVSPQLKNFHPLFCPVYALDNRLQANHKISKWNPRARLGIYLGRSPRHSRNVHLVLSTSTGLVSPQFHVEFDDLFTTVQIGSSEAKLGSTWQKLSGLGKSTFSIAAKVDKVSTQDDLSNDLHHSELLPIHEPPPQDPLVQTQDQNDIVDEQSIDVEQANQVVNEEGDGLGTEIDVFGNRRSARIRMKQQEQGVTTYAACTSCDPDPEQYYFAFHTEDYNLQNQMEDPISFLAKTDADTMYLHQAMSEPDKDSFKLAIAKEIADHCKRKHWVVIPRSAVPPEQDVLPAVWSMKRKRDLITRMPIKHKARINIHGGKQEYGVNYYETFSPVVTWTTIRLSLTFALIQGWMSRQIDFVLAFPQAPIEFDMYMEIPKGIDVEGGNSKTHVLKLLKNLYGLKQAARQFYLHLRNGLLKLKFQLSSIDECLFYRRDILFIVYVDDGIIYSRSDQAIDELISELKSTFDVEDKGTVVDYLGIHFSRDADSYRLTQTHLIDQLVEDVGLKDKQFKIPKIPAHSSKILLRRADEKPFDHSKFHYRSVIGKLNYLEKNTRPDIAYAVHQLARFSSDPKVSHGEAAIHLVKYLHGTRTQGLHFRPNPKHSLTAYVDADFSGNWDRLTAINDASTAKSRSGFIVLYAGCPLMWSSKLQTSIALSTTEAEYVALSNSLREIIPMMKLISEMNEHGWGMPMVTPRIHCRVFEDNSGALELAKVPKMRPRTKHINIIYHHFRTFVRDGKVTIWPIDTNDQPADMLTKPLSVAKFVKFRKFLIQW